MTNKCIHLHHENVMLHKVQVEHVVRVHEGLRGHCEAIATPDISPSFPIGSLQGEKANKCKTMQDEKKY